MIRLIFDFVPTCLRVALVENEELVEFNIEYASMRGIVGNIYKGRVEKVIDTMHCAFVNIGLERNGFLYTGESLVEDNKLTEERQINSKKFKNGDVIMCQVVKDQFGTKGPRLTTDISIPGSYVVLLPNSEFVGISRKIENYERKQFLLDFVKENKPKGMGIIIRSSCNKAEIEDISIEMEKLKELWLQIEKDYSFSPEKKLIFEERDLLKRVVRDTLYENVDEFIVNNENMVQLLEEEGIDKDKIKYYDGQDSIFVHYGIANQIEDLASNKVPLDNGGYLIIDKTEALTVIDVNTGKFVGSKNLEQTAYEANKEAAKEIAKTLRRRNLSGIIVIDFIDMQDEKHQKQIVEYLKEQLKKDNVKTSSVEMTTLGLVELTRKKSRLPVDSFLLDNPSERQFSIEYLVFKLRDKMIAYAMRNSAYNYMVVKVNQELMDAILETGYISKDYSGILKDKKIYFGVDNTISRGESDIKFYLSEKDVSGDLQELK